MPHLPPLKSFAIVISVSIKTIAYVFSRMLWVGSCIRCKVSKEHICIKKMVLISSKLISLKTSSFGNRVRVMKWDHWDSYTTRE